MRAIVSSLIYVLVAVCPAYATSFVDELNLPAFMLNQKDPLYYSEGIVGPSGISSLCGPTSVMNWLQLRNQNAYTKLQLVQFVKLIGEDLRRQNIEINNGLTEQQLLEFLKIYNSYLQESTHYILKTRTQLQTTDLLNQRTQILMLRYMEPMRAGPGGVRRDDFKIPLSGNHFVLKIGAETETSTLLVIDPENPEYLTRLTLAETQENGMKIFRVKGQTPKDLAAFRFGVFLQWSINGAIEEEP